MGVNVGSGFKPDRVRRIKTNIEDVHLSRVGRQGSRIKEV
jgi:hypothetical protein